MAETASQLNSPEIAKPQRDSKGRFLPGHARSSNGRPPLPDFHAEFIAAMRTVEKHKAQSVFERAWEMAWNDETLMAALLRKYLPDLSHQTGQTPPTQVNVIYGHEAAASRVQVVEPVISEKGNGRNA